MTNYVITKWCKTITDDKKDHYVNKDKVTKEMIHKFRILDDDEIYGYGVSDQISFAPLSHYRPLYGVTGIQYKNPTNGKYEFL